MKIDVCATCGVVCVKLVHSSLVDNDTHTQTRKHTHTHIYIYIYIYIYVYIHIIIKLEVSTFPIVVRFSHACVPGGGCTIICCRHHIYAGKAVFFLLLLCSLMMSANNRVHYDPLVMFVCLHIRIKSVISIIFHAIYAVLCIPHIHFSYDDWENTCTLSYYHHQICVWPIC